MLAGRIRIRADRERRQDRARDGPAPAKSRRRDYQRGGGDQGNEHSHLEKNLRCLI